MNSGSNASKLMKMKINQTLKRELVLKTVEVELKANEEANEQLAQ